MVTWLFKKTILSLKDFLLLFFLTSLLFLTILAGYHWSNDGMGKYFLLLSLVTNLAIGFYIFSIINRYKSIYSELNNINKYFDLALEGAYIGIWDWYLDDNSVRYDRRWAEMLGLRLNEIEMSYDTWKERVHPDDLEKSVQRIQDYRDGKTSRYENIHRLKHKNGHWVYILAKGRFSDWDKNGRPIRFSGTHLDVTEYETNKDLLASTSERLDLALSAANFGVWDLNLWTKRLLFDHRMLKIMNLNESDAIYLDDWAKLIHPEDRVSFIEKFGIAKDTQQKFDTEFRIITNDGDIKYLRVISNFQSSEGKKKNIERIVGIAWDITNQVLIGQELKLQSKVAQHNAKLASIGQLAAGVGHEINNPLAIIKGFLSVIHKEVLKNPVDITKVLSFLEKTLIASDRISNIVSGLRNFSRSDQDQHYHFNVNDLLNETVSLLKEIYSKEGVQLTCEFNGLQNISIYGNRGKIQQVLMNIISNAKDSLNDHDNGQIQIISTPSDTSIIISIKDNGVGIDDSIKDKIFDAFFTTKEVNEGTGIGLALAHSIIRDHDGEISFSSQNNLGTEFIIKLPINKASPTATAPKKIQNNASIENLPCKVILAEDEEDIREYLTILFEDLGMQVQAFADGKSAYDAFCKGGVDLIISDVKMPIMDGLSLLKLIRQQTDQQQPKFILITGGVALDLKNQDKELKDLIDGYLFKPFEKEQILGKLSLLFPNHSTQ